MVMGDLEFYQLCLIGDLVLTEDRKREGSGDEYSHLLKIVLTVTLSTALGNASWGNLITNLHKTLNFQSFRSLTRQM